MTKENGYLIYERIKHLATIRKTNLKKLAMDAGFKSPNTIYNYKTGVVPTNPSLKAIAEVLQTTPEYLKGETNDWMIHADNNQNGDAISNEDLSQAIDNARSFNGKPITDNDKNIIKGILKGYFSQKQG